MARTCVIESILFLVEVQCSTSQPRTTDIPTAESLKLTSHATSTDGDPALPPSRATETTLKRDEWMMMPPSAVTVPTPDDRAPTSVIASSRARDSMEEESLTEGYGDQAVNSRSVGGGVDFFSSLGTERKRKEKEKPVADKVSRSVHWYWIQLIYYIASV